MQVQTSKTLHPLVWLAGVALIVFCGAGVAAMLGWIGGPSAKTAEPTPIGQARPPEEARAVAKARLAAVCTQCGVVQSVHEVDTKGAGSGIGAVGGVVLGNEAEKQLRHTKAYEITVRFDDGAIRTITEPTAPSWHVGDKVKVVNGFIHGNS